MENIFKVQYEIKNGNDEYKKNSIFFIPLDVWMCVSNEVSYRIEIQCRRPFMRYPYTNFTQRVMSVKAVAI